MAEEKEYDLKASIQEVGILYPILVDAKGRVIDGNHRLDIDPQWPAFKLQHVNTDGAFHLARLIANWHRRQLKPEDKTQMLKAIAEATDWTPKVIAEKTGIPYTTIMMYFPEQLKNREMQELAQKSHEKRKEKVATTVVASESNTLKPETVKQEKPREVKGPTFAFRTKDPKSKLIEKLDVWFLSPGNPVLKALVDYCYDKEIQWTTVVEQALKEFFKKEGYL